MVLLRGLNEITFAEQVPNGHQFVSMQQPPPTLPRIKRLGTNPSPRSTYITHLDAQLQVKMIINNSTEAGRFPKRWVCQV